MSAEELQLIIKAKNDEICYLKQQLQGQCTHQSIKSLSQQQGLEYLRNERTKFFEERKTVMTIMRMKIERKANLLEILQSHFKKILSIPGSPTQLSIQGLYLSELVESFENNFIFHQEQALQLQQKIHELEDSNLELKLQRNDLQQQKSFLQEQINKVRKDFDFILSELERKDQLLDEDQLDNSKLHKELIEMESWQQIWMGEVNKLSYELNNKSELVETLKSRIIELDQGIDQSIVSDVGQQKFASLEQKIQEYHINLNSRLNLGLRYSAFSTIEAEAETAGFKQKNQFLVANNSKLEEMVQRMSTQLTIKKDQLEMQNHELKLIRKELDKKGQVDTGMKEFQLKLENERFNWENEIRSRQMKFVAQNSQLEKLKRLKE